MGKELVEKKKQLKTLITFHSPEVYERAVAEPNTSALGEALFARHFGIAIEGDTIQAKQRLAVLDGVIAPSTPLEQIMAHDTEDLEDGDLDDGPLTLPGQEPAKEATAPLALPDEPSSETAPIVPSKPVDEKLPDRPADKPVAPPAGAFAPVATTQAAPAPAVERPAAPVEPAPAAPPEPALVAPSTQYEVGARLCPTCGKDMGSDPYCLNCL